VSVVLDASATLAWIYPDELTLAIESTFERVVDEDAWTPSLWRIEVANSLSWGVKRGRLSLAKRDGALTDLARLPIFEDSETSLHIWDKTLLLSDAHHLTVYDATYLELALRLALPLATLDDDLRTAAKREGVELLGK